MKAGPAGPMKKNYGPMLMASPMKVDPEKEKRMASSQEKEVADDSDYVDSETGSVRTASMERLLRSKPPKGDPNFKSWQKAYNTAQANQLKKFNAK